MIAGYYKVQMVLRGYVRNDFEKASYEDVDVLIWSAEEQISKINPLRKPRLELSFFEELNGYLEIIFIFKISWQDRKADIDEYIEKVIKELENVTNIIIEEYDIESVIPDSKDATR